MSEWKPIETAPKDGTRVLVHGFWDDRAAKHCRGEPYMTIGAWSSFMSGGTGHHWMYEGCLGDVDADHICVTFTHWMPLPPPPREGA